MFRNSIALDCSRLCNDLDPKTCKFVRAYHSLTEDPTLLACNGHIRLLDHRRNPGVRQNAFRLLGHRQHLYSRLVSEFRSERVLEVAFDMATELRLGLLDAFGLKYTERKRQKQQQPPKSFTPRDHNKYPTEDCVLDSVKASNYVFVETLLESSMYYGASGSVSACNEFFAKEKNVKPLSQSVRGLYRHDMIEFDLQSAYPSVTSLYNISPETTAVVERDVLKRLDVGLDALVSNNSPCPAQAQHAANVMTSIYQQIGHINEIDSNLVIVALRPEIYVGVLARTMERLVLKRRNRNRLLDPFYKKLANVVYGCTGKATAFNDLFSPQCASAIRSLCKSVMLRTLQNVPPENVLFTQTDGALLYTGSRDGEEDETGGGARTTCKDLKGVISTSIESIVLEVGNVATSVRLVARVRAVDMCLLIDQNRYLLLYADGKTVCKGQERQPLSFVPGGTRINESLLSEISQYIRDRPESKPDVFINGFLDACFGRLHELNTDRFVDWSVPIRIPSTNEVLYSESNQISLTGLRLKGYSTDECRERSINTSVARFGDVVAVWPVLVWNNGEVFNEFRTSRPQFNTAVVPNYILVMRNFLRYWVKWLFTVSYPDRDEKTTMNMFHAICKKYERYLVECSQSSSRS